MDDFLVRALLAGIGVAILVGPLGCFVVWRRMAYFGAALSHSALLGVALGFALGIDPMIGILALCLSLALLVVILERRRLLPTDTLMGILAHSALAFGILAIALMEDLRVDLMGYLFGDVLAVDLSDLLVIYGAAGSVLLLLFVMWRWLLSATVHKDLAVVEGVPVTLVETVFMLTIAFAIAIGMKIVGILLIVSLLILPAATARRFARTPEMMAFGAVAFGILAVVLGLAGSVQWDAPSGPSIVAAATILFAIIYLLPRRRED